jgi:hypothetical protein
VLAHCGSSVGSVALTALVQMKQRNAIEGCWLVAMDVLS